MRNQKIKNFLKKTKPDSGFTLTELLTGLIMSIFVTGALGFGLLQILRVTAKETAKTNARNEASRAVEFISDELRRARGIEVDNSIAFINRADNASTPDIDESVAPNFSLPTGGEVRLALQIPGVSQRVIYSVAPPLSTSSWQGPLVVYRWGPDLGNDGAYTNANNPSAWSNSALIDGVDNTDQSIDCGVDGSGNPISVTYQGFFACVVDDDGDGVAENGTIDLDGDGEISAEESADVDGFGETASIFLTGGIDTIANNGTDNDENYTAQTRAVARARDANVNNAMAVALAPIAMKTLGGNFVCNSLDGSDWTMRMDFDLDPYDSDIDDSTTKWEHEPGRQSQPIGIDRDRPNDLTMYSVPIENEDLNCISRGNASTTIGDDLSTTSYSVSYSMKLREDLDDDPNDGIDPPRDPDPNFWQTFNGDHSDYNYDNPNVDQDGKVIVLKHGSKLEPIYDPDNYPNGLTSIDFESPVSPAPLYPGLDPDGEGPEPRKQSLGEFLADTNNFPGDPNAPYATANGDGSYTIRLVNQGNEEDPDRRARIVAFEIGQDDNGLTPDENGDINPRRPGYDMQDNIVIMRHDIFANDRADTGDDSESSDDGSYSSESDYESSDYQ